MFLFQMSGFNSQLMEKEEATRSIEQKFKDAKVGEAGSLFLLYNIYCVYSLEQPH